MLHKLEPTKSREVIRLYPAGVIAFEISGMVSFNTLFQLEQACVVNAVLRRKQEFAAGRLCARATLEFLGYPPSPILIGEGRQPLWPNGVVGSISHTNDYCVAVASHEGSLVSLGIDAQTIGQVSEDMYPLIFTKREIHNLERTSIEKRAYLATVIFSAKEAFYKCHYQLNHSWIDFLEVTVEAVIYDTLLICTNEVCCRGRFINNRGVIIVGVAFTRGDELKRQQRPTG